jgi:hypothetical protein
MSCPSTAAATASARKNNLCGTNCYGKTPATYLLQQQQQPPQEKIIYAAPTGGKTPTTSSGSKHRQQLRFKPQEK